ncbi:MAG: lytic transglycosylase domain-containing protein [Rhodospirillales bacterium]|nr:lytic transglycosylase domain-containing protein [Rhodospirillales bacterium]
MVMTALGPALAGPSVPLPLQKPLITDVALPVPASDTIPVPDKKPNFGRPDVAQLLQFGQAPVPRPKPMGKPGTALSDSDALLYKKIFAYQALGAWDKADELLGLLGDFRLRGHVLYQRYMHPTAYSADFSELSGWMASYADHPGADKIYALAAKRSPKDYNGTIRKPVKGSGINGYLDILSEHDRSYRAPRRSEADAEKVAKLESALRKDLGNGGPTAAYKKLMGDKTAKLLDPVEYDEWRAQIANSYMMTGKLDKAKELAIASARRSAEKVPLAGWVGGLVAWRQKDYRLAAPLFELTAKSPYASDWTAAAGAYWASRAHMRAGNVKDVSIWLRHAAGHPRTFYGLIATRALGWDFDFNWDIPRYDSAHRQVLDSVPAAQRAMLLVRAGQYHLAEKELKQISPDEKPAMTEALLAYADHAGLPSYAMRLAASTTAPDGGLYDAALYPESPWKPQNGYKVDRALIYALIRQESKFNPAAESRSGATGLMQLMPATASFISGRRDYRSREGQYSLTDPQLNLDIGQRYVENLLYQDHIGTELFSLVIAYNAGPGNLRKWKQELRGMQGDPLLFVESIPMKETRAFVERVMANYWIYRLKMDQATPSLDGVAEGHWARYVQLDGVRQASGTLPVKTAHYN